MIDNIEFNDLKAARAYCTNLFRYETNFSPLIVSLRYSQVPAQWKDLQQISIPIDDLGSCASPWTYVLLYVESKSCCEEVVDKNQLEEREFLIGEQSGKLRPFGFINTQLLHSLASTSRERAHLHANQLQPKLFNVQGCDSYLFDNAESIIGDHETNLSDIRATIEARSAHLVFAMQNKHSCIPTDLITASLYLTTLTSVRNEHVAYMMMLWAFSRTAREWRLPADRREELQNEWIQHELALLQYRLCTSLTHNLKEFLSDKYMVLDRMSTIRAFDQDQNFLRFMEHSMLPSTHFVATDFEYAFKSTGAKHRRLYLNNGVAIFPFEYSLGCVLHCAETRMRQQLECFEQLHLPDPRFKTLIELCMATFLHQTKLHKPPLVNRDAVSVSEAANWAPQCVRSLLHRVQNATADNRVRYADRVQFGLMASGLNINWDELGKKISDNFNRIYPGLTAAKRKALLGQYHFGYTRKEAFVPNCTKWIEKGLCPLQPKAQAKKLSPQEMCASELRLRTNTNFTIVYKPSFYFDMLRRKFKLPTELSTSVFTQQPIASPESAKPHIIKKRRVVRRSLKL